MLTINTHLMSAANVFAGKEETRYYLQGVFIEATHERVFYAATDGHRLIAFHHAAEWSDNVNEEERKISIIVPSGIIGGMKINKKTAEAELRPSGEGMWIIKNGGLVTAFQELDATFPDWRRVVPEKTNGEIAQFNGDYLAAFRKVGRIIGAENTAPGIYHNGDGPALIDLGVTEYDYVACIMPLRCYATFNQKTTRPDWVKAR